MASGSAARIPGSAAADTTLSLVLLLWSGSPILARQRPRLLILQARLDLRLTHGPSQQPGFRPGDLGGGTRFGERRPLAGDVGEMLDLCGRGSRAGCGARLFQGDLGQVQLGLSQGAHARDAARALDGGMRVIESRVRRRAGTAGDRHR